MEQENQQRVCFACGAEVAARDRFCGNCGGALLDAASRQTDAPIQSSSSNSDSANGATSMVAAPNNQPNNQPSNESNNQSRLTGGNAGSDDLGTSWSGKSKRQTVKLLDDGSVLIGRYEIAQRIGGGGMGAVYLARDKNLGDAPRAVKEMIQAQLDERQHEKSVADFRRESMLLASLEHPSIPTIYDYFYDEAAGRFYLVMKYISGGDLLARLRSAPQARIEERVVAEWSCQIADVLDYLHNQPRQIIYRDLKPANIMIDGATGRVMLVDFGIARWVSAKEHAQEKGVTAVGTMGYAPPELFSGKVEPRSDIYSLGATMFHLLTGCDPQENPLLIFDFNKHPRPRALNPRLSVEMERILLRAVEYKPEDRFRSASEMRQALEQHIERLRRGTATYTDASDAARQSDTTAAMTRVDVAVSGSKVFCGSCGAAIDGEDLYCAQCGAPQPLAGTSAALRRASAGRVTARLIVSGTTELDASFQIQKENNLVGRQDPQANIFPEIDLSRFDPHTKVSRRHARIWREGNNFLVEDLGSVNGTVVNEEKDALPPRAPRLLESGDRIRLGETTLHFLVG